MRPVDKPLSTDIGVTMRYVPATNFKFTKGGVKNTAIAKWATSNPTVLQALNELQRINFKSQPTADEKKMKKALEKRVGDECKKAGPVLMLFLGPYCSYCETFIAQLGEVEHVLPKSIITIKAISWDN